MGKPTVFISYSHKDEAWKDRLVTHLGVLAQQGLLDLWDDRRIGTGEEWRTEIAEAMGRASVAILLVTADFLTSQFILGEEVPRLLQRRDAEGLRVFPVIVKPCAWKMVPWLSRMQVRPKDGRPLSRRDRSPDRCRPGCDRGRDREPSFKGPCGRTTPAALFPSRRKRSPSPSSPPPAPISSAATGSWRCWTTPGPIPRSTC